MFEKMEALRMSAQMMGHAHQRQRLVAENVANADTPGYRAQDLKPFADIYARGDSTGLRMTRAGHMTGGDMGPATRIVSAGSEWSPNGNAVSIEEEMVRAAETSGQNRMASSIYSSSLSMLRTSLGRR